MKGNYLEQVARHFLTIDPLWADQLGAVWLWKDWPGRGSRPDTGIDLVAETQTGGLLAVQVKFFAADHRVQKSDLDSFFEAMGKEPFTEGLVIDTTSGDWSVNALEALKNRTKPVRRVGLDELRHSQIDWSSYTLTTPAKAPVRHERKMPRTHQHDAITAVMEAFSAVGDDAIDRGKLIMACGTGKTFTALKLAERWTRERASGASTILFMVPSLALLQQSLTEWSAERDPELDFQAFAVGSDANVGRVKNGDITSVMLEDLGAPATTDGAKLAEYLDARAEVDEGMTVVFSTYQSIDAVAEAQQLGGAPTFDLVICDEAHRTTGVTLADEDESHFVKIHDDAVISAEKRVYMTATPRIFAPEVKNTAREKDAVLVSMDDESLFGPVLYRIGFDEAVRKQLLTDYKVVVLGVSEDQVIEGLQRELSEDGHELQIGDVAKLVGCYNALAKRGGQQIEGDFGADSSPMRRAVAFARDIKTSKKISSDFEALVDEHLSDWTNDDSTDDLTVQSRHVDGTMNAAQRGELLDWLKAEETADRHGRPVARVLTNARCLSEGVDVPSLDAVLFLHPRKSQVDVVQAVGRVMRRSEGKRVGYIVLPIAIPAGVTPEEALNDNERYKVVWQVLQALRAHDERLDAAINQAKLTGTLPEQVTITSLDLTSTKGTGGHGIGTDGGSEGGPEGGDGTSAPTSPSRPQALFSMGDASQWKDAVYAKLVAKVGDRMYWDDWAADIADIAKRFIALIRAHVDAPDADRAPFEQFLTALRATVNPEVSDGEAVEMLAQHLITKPIFEAMFPEGTFTQDNPVSLSLEKVLDTFHDNAAFAREREPLEAFYTRVTERIRGLTTVSAKQQMLVTLYDKFFSKAFPMLADQMGIVFTPVEVVDYILRSADDVLNLHFGKRLSDEGVNILEPFVGTGTFVTRLMQIGLIKPEDLTRKYSRELFANEIVLLSYYIAAVNIESVYRELCAEHGEEPVEGGFPGISLTDTFAMDERDSQVSGLGFGENTERVARQQETPLHVVVMNPPYRSGQSSANDASQNAKYPGLDARIRASYVERSTGTNKNGLYDSYYRALRWATDRIDEGVIAFVSNSGFVDGGTAEGVRLSWMDEFSDIIVYNLRGNARTMGERRRREAGNVFGEGSQTGVAITLLVKTGEPAGQARVHYRDVGDFLSGEEKLERLHDEGSVTGTEFEAITPNEAGDWIHQRDERFAAFVPLGDKATKGRDSTAGVFREFSNGLKTNRDSWTFGFSRPKLEANIRRHVDHLNAERERVYALREAGATELVENLIVRDDALGSWSRPNIADLKKNVPTVFDPAGFRSAAYRPFMRQYVYFDRTAKLNEMLYLTPKMWPMAAHENVALAVGMDGRKPSPPLIVDRLADLHVNGDAQLFPRYIWEPVVDGTAGGLDFSSLSDESGEVVNGYRRVDNITDATLATYRKVHGDEVTKDDIFYGIYALLHHPTYRETYAADLQKMLPRIPQVTGFLDYARIGRALAELHLRYEDAPADPGVQEEWSLEPPADELERYRIEKLAWGARKDRTSLRYNAHLTLTGIPEEEALYTVGGRSPLDWILDRYQVKIDKKSGIVNDPNDWLREQNAPRYVVDLIKSLVTVSLSTQRLIEELPDFTVIDGY
ncbi:damage-inducible protein [Microbacterium sorbitolivorans]|uniref:Damage-inducible protein n=2 Tax=Microbacterium sorbitolivorans TaxID=1867410 RepID=A0A367Y939_9MICO|nr:damage-inducible protein [Microbacterium sorbitolivorans]